MADQVEFQDVKIVREDKRYFPLTLRKILCNEYIDHAVPYRKLKNPKTRGRLYSHHPTRKISMIIDYSIIAKIHHERIK